jgi:hypothetical protein
VAIFQHSLPFLQSESFHTHVWTIHRRAIGPLSHHNGISAYSPSLTCHLPAPTVECLHRPPYKLMCSSRPTYKHVCVRPMSRPDSQLHKKSVDNSLVSMELNYSLFTLLYGSVPFIVMWTCLFHCCVTGES